MEKNSVYMILETVRAEDGGYIPCIATENEAGYNRTDWNWGKSYPLAKDLCDEKNRVLGFSPREAYKIVASSMMQGKI